MQTDENGKALCGSESGSRTGLGSSHLVRATPAGILPPWGWLHGPTVAPKQEQKQDPGRQVESYGVTDMEGRLREMGLMDT